MTKSYSHDKKERLVSRINKIKRKKDLVKIYKIITDNNEINTNQNDNGIFIVFNNLSDDTYHKINILLNSIENRSKSSISNSSAMSDECNIDYKPYANDDFPSQSGISPKLKYSNREKNIIKRKRYDININSENNEESNIIYKHF